MIRIRQECFYCIKLYIFQIRKQLEVGIATWKCAFNAKLIFIVLIMKLRFWNEENRFGVLVIVFFSVLTIYSLVTAIIVNNASNPSKKYLSQKCGKSMLQQTKQETNSKLGYNVWNYNRFTVYWNVLALWNRWKIQPFKGNERKYRGKPKGGKEKRGVGG